MNVFPARSWQFGLQENGRKASLGLKTRWGWDICSSYFIFSATKQESFSALQIFVCLSRKEEERREEEEWDELSLQEGLK